jgi:hypothetical protein
MIDLSEKRFDMKTFQVTEEVSDESFSKKHSSGRKRLGLL